uniref:Uncharacterized protein n=1 Tax=Solanum tuberosum TaxID=4113 RepID=M0ZXA9_SOLTU
MSTKGLACYSGPERYRVKVKRAIRKFRLPLPNSSLIVSTVCSWLSPWIDDGLKKPPILCAQSFWICITATVGTELADAYSPDTIIASFPGKEVHNQWTCSFSSGPHYWAINEAQKKHLANFFGPIAGSLPAKTLVKCPPSQST